MNRTERIERLGHALGLIWGGPASLLARRVRRIPPIPKAKLRAAWQAHRAARKAAHKRAAAARRARHHIQRRHALYSALHAAERAATGAPHRIATGTARGARALAGKDLKTGAIRYSATTGITAWGAAWANNADALPAAAAAAGTVLMAAALAVGKGRETCPETRAHRAEANRDAVDLLRGINALMGTAGVRFDTIAEAFNASPATPKSTTWTGERVRGLVQRVAPDLPLTSRLHCDGKQGSGIARADWNSWCAKHSAKPAAAPAPEPVESVPAPPHTAAPDDATPTKWDTSTIATALTQALNTTALNHPPPPSPAPTPKSEKPQVTAETGQAIPLDIAPRIAPEAGPATRPHLRLIGGSRGDDEPTADHSETTIDETVLRHARAAIGDAHGIHLSTILTHAKQANDVPAHWNVSDVRRSLERLGVPIEKQLSVRGVNAGRGVRAEALQLARARQPRPASETS